MAAHRYWRARVTRSANGIDTAINELELRATVGGANQATGGTPISGSEYSASYIDDYAFDGNASNSWNSSGLTSTAWVGYDAGAGNSFDVGEVLIKARGDFIGNAPEDIAIEWSDDGSGWTTKWTVVGQTGWSTNESRAFAYAVSTGAVIAGTGENVDRGGLTDWSSPGNITADDGTETQCNAASGSNYLVARNFGLSVPSDATITGVTVHAEMRETSSGVETISAQLQDETAALVGSAKTRTCGGTGAFSYSYGGSGQLWGATLTPAIVNDPDFGVRLWFTTGHNVFADYVSITVEYTEASGVDSTATTSQAQTIAAEAGISLDVTTTTSQAQTAAAIIESAATYQAQSVAAEAGVAADTTATTSQAQSVAAEMAVEGVITSQAQTTAAEAGVSTDTAGSTSQAQTASAEASVISDVTAALSQAQTVAATAAAQNNWAFVKSAQKSGGADVTLAMDADALTAGNHVVVHVTVTKTGATGTLDVTDTAGNTYSNMGEAYTGDINLRVVSFAAVNCAGHASNVITATLGSGTVTVLQAHHFSSPGSAQADAYEGKVSAASATSLTTDPFSTSGRGAVSAGECNPSADSGTTNGEFTDNSADLAVTMVSPRPSTSTASGYGITTTALSNATITFTGSRDTYRALSVVTLVDQQNSIATSQAQTAAAVAGVSSSVSASTSQAQTTQSYSGDAVAATSQAQTAAAQASVNADTAAATSQAQSAAAVAAPESDLAGTTSQAQTAAASVELGWSVASATSQAQTAAAVAGLDSPVSASTSSATTAAAQATPETIAQTATQSAQAVAGAMIVESPMEGATSSAARSSVVAGVAADTAATTSSASTQAGTLGSLVPSTAATQSATTASASSVSQVIINEVATRTGNSVHASVRGESENSTQTGTVQSTAAEAGVAADMSVTTSSAARAQAAAVVSLDLSAATSSASTAASEALGEWIVSVTTAQAQAAQAAAEAVTQSAATTRQAQSASAQAGVSVAVSVATGSFAYVAYARVDVAEAVGATTSSVGGTAAATGAVSATPDPYFVVASVSFYNAVAGAAGVQTAVGAASRIIPAVQGDADARPL